MTNCVKSNAAPTPEEKAFVRKFNLGLALAVSIWALLCFGTVIA